MHVLTVLDHPDPESFCAAVAQSFMQGAEAEGHSVELADLNAEGFDPRWSLADIKGEANGNAAADVRREQDRLERADAVCLVFPLFWWGMPAMTKGWVDRVWNWGWAYDQLDDPERSLQRPRSGVLLIPAGAQADEMAGKGHLAALETNWLAGTFGYFGFSPRKLEILYGATGPLADRKALLEQSYRAGADLAAPRGQGD